MTPIEKAKELVEKCMECAYVPWHGGGDEMTQEEAAKTCATIAVDEILVQAALLDEMDGRVMYLKGLTFYPPTANVTYWESVKEEIQKL